MLNLQRDNAIVFIGTWYDACALWRLYMPHLNRPGSAFHIFNPHKGVNYNLVAGNDIVVVQRCCTPPQYAFIRTASELGMKVIYDLDDNVWAIPPYNPAHELLSNMKEGFAACIRMVDAVTVSTKALAKAVREHVKFMVNARTGKQIEIIVAENRIDTRLFAPPVTNTSDTVLVGWAGSTSHIGDIDIVQPAILHAATLPKVHIQFRGCELAIDNPVSKLPNFEFKYWTPVAEYGARMPLWGWDIALAPVIDNRFNECKSAIKMVEAGYCGIPCLASWVRPYEEFCSHDKELQFLLCAGASSWERKLTILINDAAMRLELGQRMRAVVDKHYTYSVPHEGWDKVFNTVRSL